MSGDAASEADGPLGTLRRQVVRTYEMLRGSTIDARPFRPGEDGPLASFDVPTNHEELDRYWVNAPFAYVVITRDTGESEDRYHAVEPDLDAFESTLLERVREDIREPLLFRAADENPTDEVILEDELESLLEEYAVEVDMGTFHKLRYYLVRDFNGFGRLDPLMHDPHIEDVSCDGYDLPIFVYHDEYTDVATNVIFEDPDELDNYVVRLAQQSGRHISVGDPVVGTTLPDGSRVELALGEEVTPRGSAFTIRQYADDPFTPIDLIEYGTFSIEQMAYLWLAIENNKSLIFAGGTASGKTTSLNAVSLFIPSNSKIVSIEDTREVELPQRNWVASVTRPSFGDDDKGDVDEFDLLEAALRQRPDYIVMGEVRGEEGRTLFQVMSTGHTTYTTFHADSVGEVIKRFTTEPINVSKTLFTALDLVSIQTQTRVDGRKVRRNKTLTEINEYSAENDEINVRDVYEWRAETDEYIQMGNSNTLEEIKFDRGWSTDKLDQEIFKRKLVLAYLIENGINTYTEVAATIQAFINDPDTILTLIANERLERSLEDLREMESVSIDIDPEKEELVPRPDAGEEMLAEARAVIEDADDLFEEYRRMETPDIVSALSGLDAGTDATDATDPVDADAAFEPVPGDEDARATELEPADARSEAEGENGDIEFGDFVRKAGDGGEPR
jgi:flagellar protein FlaI